MARKQALLPLRRVAQPRGLTERPQPVKRHTVAGDDEGDAAGALHVPAMARRFAGAVAADRTAEMRSDLRDR